MSATAALFLLIEATTACGPAAQPRLGGGAQIAPAILGLEVQPSELPEPTPAGVTEPSIAEPDEAEPGADQPETDPGADQCSGGHLSIA